MAEQLEALPSTIEGTYKVREFEGVTDVYFNRKLGFYFAKFFAALGITPTAVTLLGGVVGLAAGHLYYYRDLRLNIIGMLLHILANVLDNADGQLARLTNQQSRIGRVIDPVVDHIIFTNIYFHLGFRCMAQGLSPAVLFLAFLAGISHAVQAACADFYRNAYLYFVKNAAEFDSAARIRSEYEELSWNGQWWPKLLLWLYLGVTTEQEFLFPGLARLRDTVRRNFGGKAPEWLQNSYRTYSQPSLKGWGLLMTNTRMFVLFLLLAFDQVALFFWFELIVLNLLLGYLISRQHNLSRFALERITREPAETVLRGAD